VDNLGIVLMSPSEPGFYRLVFRDSSTRAISKDDLIVQASVSGEVPHKVSLKVKAKERRKKRFPARPESRRSARRASNPSKGRPSKLRTTTKRLAPRRRKK